ncbi:MAG: CrcB family protein, partial [Synechococcaceae bacterium WB9_3_282]|nr:CrcB family protein [Synechococcaceae bacterium WBA_3_309]NDE23188.1 CrcB family protein [Synechococcaceae bacterium WB9_3_282]
ASFCLGLLVALNQLCLSNQLMLLLATGFLGSLSTFSTFVVELLVLLHKQASAEALLLALASVVSGLLALELGLAIGGLQ